MGLWGSLASLRGLGPRDPGSNPGNPIYKQLNETMANKLKKVKSSGRFGARYGRSVRSKMADAETKQRVKQICPYCKKSGVKRLSKGIWKCSKCNKKFASDTFYLAQ